MRAYERLVVEQLELAALDVALAVRDQGDDRLLRDVILLHVVTRRWAVGARAIGSGAGAVGGVVVGLLLLTTCLLLTATVSSASRPLKVSSEGDDGDAQHHTVESPPVGYIQTVVVVGAAEQDGGAAAGHRLMSVDMLGGIKNSGPSPGDGH